MLSDHKTEISFTSEIRVRFTETDPLGIVWHGNYIQYFEDGREAFGREHGISYLEQKANGYTSPIVKSSCEHKLPLRYGDVATIKTTNIHTTVKLSTSIPMERTNTKTARFTKTMKVPNTTRKNLRWKTVPI